MILKRKFENAGKSWDWNSGVGSLKKHPKVLDKKSS